MDTIFALSSGSVPSGVAVVRLSGSLCRHFAKDHLGGMPEARVASLRSIRSRNNELIDQALVLFFPAPASFTGEDVLELHCHGSPAVVRDVTALLGSIDGVRAAEAGEFAQRAFLNGKMDLTVAEGLADLIEAESTEQRRLALRQSQGEVFELIRGWQNRVLGIRALVEAGIDFADEEDVSDHVDHGSAEAVASLIEDMRLHLDHVAASEIVRSGILVVLAGVPNAGKSSLFNALVGSDRVIVSEQPGTTRDFVEERIIVGGQLVRLVDTAGLRLSDDEIEMAGVERSRRLVEDAELIVELSQIGIFEADKDAGQVIKVLSQSDRGHDVGKDTAYDIAVSVHDPDSVLRLRKLLAERISRLVRPHGVLVPMNRRQADHVSEAVAALCGGQVSSLPAELRADSLDRANRALGKVVGQSSVEDLLGAVFSRFCIGK